MDDANGIPLAAYIRALRSELEAAQREGRDAQTRFGVGPVEMEFEVAVTREREGHGGLQIWVFELGGAGKKGDASTQKVTLTLTPVDEEGRPLTVSDRLWETPR
jgi:Trypsin-co-occurring domain 2